ncbi:transcriptional regulator GlxA family with amidase domain [Actinocorallia herbida]|uniref:Transcriptional regulator GlxA family with amidase domain n=1 Tax=Actinocorallia herbida TaxID=58109 RepID=A0A3N1DCS0_9ACTN|nr:helix-turn-helix domain-containing protein [Actinocorallia herbida]ROO91266.1 transcriptional regulator GlxA family with amidase domain [Actinocorallia herbida]
MPHRVAVLVMDDFATLDVGVPGQVFWAARGPADYEVLTCTDGGRPVRCQAGYAIVPDHDLSLLATADTVVVPGVHGGAVMDGVISEPVRDALRGSSARIMSICTGAFVLAAAGLLDGLRATTHWRNAARLAELFPAVEVDPDVLFVDEGDILTSAGVASGIDLCLHVIRRDHGADVANRTARRCVTAPMRDGGQAQFIERPIPEPSGTSTAPARTWALHHLARPVSVPDLAARAGMGPRTFTRRFRDETGMSPARWLTQQRLAHARELLEATDLPIEEVARLSGFTTPVTLRQHLHTAVGLSPLSYRRSFRH